MDDASLTALYFERDEYAVIETDKRYGKLSFRIAMNILGNASDAEEVVNDVYQRLWQSIPPENPRDFGAYLAKITRNLAYNRIEASHTAKRYAPSTVVCDELSEILTASEEDVTDRLAIERALHTFLSGLDKNVKRYFYNEGLDALARLFKSTRGAVKVKLYRLRKQLKHLLEKEGVLVKE